MRTRILLSILCFLTIFLSCDIEKVQLEQISEETDLLSKNKKTQKDITIIEGSNTTDDDFFPHCKTVNLIAGQNHVAGTVNVDIEGDNLVITFLTSAEWQLGATHLHVTNCEDEAFPTTGSGNPKIGNFEYFGVHENGVTEVVYIIDLYSDETSIYNEFCFAAHAEVSGPSSETAWAEGEEFDGKSWAMYVEVDLTDCDGGFVGG